MIPVGGSAKLRYPKFPTIVISPSGDSSGIADSAALRNAINTIAASGLVGGTIIPAPGHYYLRSDQVYNAAYHAARISSNVCIKGENWETTKFTLAATTEPHNYGGFIFLIDGTSNITIEGIWLDGNKSVFTDPGFAYGNDGPSGSNIRVVGATNVTVQHCRLSNAIYHGLIAIDGCNKIKVDDNIIDSNNYRAVHYHGDTAGVLPLLGSSISNNLVYQNGGGSGNSTNSGIFLALDGASYVNCSDNYIKDEVGHGLDISGLGAGSTLAAKKNLVSGNIVVGCGHYGMLIDSSAEDVNVIDNMFIGCGVTSVVAGIGLGSTIKNINISGNHVIGSGKEGVLIGTGSSSVCSNITIHNNHIRDNALHGIYLNVGGHTSIKINNNQILENGVTAAAIAYGILSGDPASARFKGLDISHNTIEKNKAHAILLYDTDDSIIQGNIIRDNYESTGPRGRAVWLRGTCDNVRVLHNIATNDNVTNNLEQIQVDSTCTNCDVIGNQAECTVTNKIVFQNTATGRCYGNRGTESLPTSGVIQGVATTTNDNATTGSIGEFVTATVASGSAVSLTNATGANVTNISLTAGDWDISGQVDFILTGATSTLHQSGISLTSATLPSQAGGGGLGTDAGADLPLPTTALSGTLSQKVGSVRLSISATTTVYLVAQSAFSVGTETAYGTIRARRVR